MNNIRDRINIILDTDTYNECDDQFALTYLIKHQDLFNIEAITIAPYSHHKNFVSVKILYKYGYKIFMTSIQQLFLINLIIVFDLFIANLRILFFYIMHYSL